MATKIPSNRASFTLDAVVAATGGTVFCRKSLEASSVCTDSRAVEPGALFVALKGESYDGHRFVAMAAQRGASIAIVERGRAASFDETALGGVTLVEVDDSLVALGDLARTHLDRWRSDGTRRVVAVTGSAGKTTTKEIVAALLGASSPTHRTAGNLNNRVGVPFVVFGLLPEHRFAVIEMGMSLPGELDAITSFARPDVSIVTNIGLAHAEGVGGPEGIMREKGAVYRALDAAGIAIVNADDPLATRAAEGTRAGRMLTFGRSEGATYRLTTRDAEQTGSARVTLVCPSRTVTVCLPLPGEAAAIDLASALAAAEGASGQQLSVSQIDNALAHVRVDGRATLRRLGHGIVVLDDTYNANPASMRAALATLEEIAGGRRRVVVLGEMKELGAHAEREHDALGSALASSKVSLAIGCGGLIDRTLRRAAHENRAIEAVFATNTSEALHEALARVGAGDAVLVKGSRSVEAERVVAALTEAWPEPHFSESSVLG